MICTRAITPDAPVAAFGEACPECGHTMAGHPGTINPTLDACLVCEVQAVVQQLRDQAQGDRVQLGVALQLVGELQARVELLEARA